MFETTAYIHGRYNGWKNFRANFRWVQDLGGQQDQLETNQQQHCKSWCGSEMQEQGSCMFLAARKFHSWANTVIPASSQASELNNALSLCFYLSSSLFFQPKMNCILVYFALASNVNCSHQNFISSFPYFQAI